MSGIPPMNLSITHIELLAEKVDRCFYFIGYLPATELFQDQVTLNERGYIPTNTQMQINLEGVFAVGDVRQGSLKRVAAAVGEGSSAVRSVHDYLGTST